MTDQEIEKLAGELAEAISLAITPIVRDAVRQEMQAPQVTQVTQVKRETLKLPKR